jgi:hypothetical protein
MESDYYTDPDALFCAHMQMQYIGRIDGSALQHTGGGNTSSTTSSDTDEPPVAHLPQLYLPPDTPAMSKILRQQHAAGQLGSINMGSFRNLDQKMVPSGGSLAAFGSSLSVLQRAQSSARTDVGHARSRSDAPLLLSPNAMSSAASHGHAFSAFQLPGDFNGVPGPYGQPQLVELAGEAYNPTQLQPIQDASMYDGTPAQLQYHDYGYGSTYYGGDGAGIQMVALPEGAMSAYNSSYYDTDVPAPVDPSAAHLSSGPSGSYNNNEYFQQQPQRGSMGFVTNPMLAAMPNQLQAQPQSQASRSKLSAAGESSRKMKRMATGLSFRDLDLAVPDSIKGQLPMTPKANGSPASSRSQPEAAPAVSKVSTTLSVNTHRQCRSVVTGFSDVLVAK